MIKIGFVILTWNSENYISKCIKSIGAITRFECYICVIDNGSIDGTLNELEKCSNFIKNKSGIILDVIRLATNKGTTVSRNIGIKKVYLLSDYVCILDSDTEINENAMFKMIEVLQENAKNGIVGSQMRNSIGELQNSGKNIPTLLMKIGKVFPVKKIRKKAEAMEGGCNKGKIPVGYLMSACWVMKREVIKHVGFLDEKIFYAPEDIDYCIRIWNEGYRVIYCGEAKILHEWQRISRKKIFSMHNYEHIKGLIYLYKKHKIFFSVRKYEKIIR